MQLVCNASIWLKYGENITPSVSNIFFYYNYSGATNRSSGTTFEIFDDFNRSAVGANWTSLPWAGTPIWGIINNSLQVNGSGGLEEYSIQPYYCN